MVNRFSSHDSFQLLWFAFVLLFSSAVLASTLPGFRSVQLTEEQLVDDHHPNGISSPSEAKATEAMAEIGKIIIKDGSPNIVDAETIVNEEWTSISLLRVLGGKTVSELALIKGLGSLGILTLSLITGFIPKFLFRRIDSRWINYAHAFGGGVFLSATFLYLLPDVVDGLPELEKKSGTNYPLGFLCIIGGFLMLLALERLLHEHNHSHSHSHSHIPSHSHSHDPNHNHNENHDHNYDHSYNHSHSHIPIHSHIPNHSHIHSHIPTQSHSSSHSHNPNHNHNHNHNENQDQNHDHNIGNNDQNEQKISIKNDVTDCQVTIPNTNRLSYGANNAATPLLNDQCLSDYSDHRVEDQHKNSKNTLKEQHVTSLNAASAHFDSMDDSRPLSHCRHSEPPDPSLSIVAKLSKVALKKNPIVTSLLVLCMLSFHALFESLLLGLQSNETAALAFLMAIISHKWVESLSMGIVMAKSGISSTAFSVIIVIFSAIAPVGVGIGVLVEDSVPAVLGTLFNALAMGSFVYVGTMEIISEEFRGDDSFPVRALKFFFLICGCAVISVVRIWNHEPQH